MKNMTLAKIKEITGGKLFNADETSEKEIFSVVSDSRKIAPDSLFLCIKGEKSDGHAFASEAIEKGAMAVICEYVPEGFTGPYILVESTLKATQAMAEFYRSQLDIKVVGVTGSVGKTSTKEFIAAVLSRKYKVHKTKANYNNEWGVPFTILDIQDSHEAAVIELGIDDFGQMDALAKIVKPDIAVITNIGQSHLEQFKNRDGILRAKREIFNYMDYSGTALLNGDDDKLVTVLNVKGKRPVFFGLDKHCDISAEKIIDHGFSGIEFDMVFRDGGGRMAMHINMPVPGKHLIYAALCAAYAGSALGVPMLSIKAALNSMEPVDGRSNIKKGEHFTVIDDCYNAAPASMASSIDILKNASGRKVAILGDMFELGEDSDKLHFQVGKYAGKAGLDLIICVGKSAEKMFMGAKMSTDKQVEFYHSIDEAKAMIQYLVEDGDTILVKASHGMNFTEISELLDNLNQQ
ncbi:MAG: UDP-N-acetylmuramoyl-tripeptide--D-alanyl-D-alanine ligase [Parasporobacterium sp.]|nr:UDP-N-acetylmuramoyl-tripeptide--D-alanyl-D-alanine ligase [Parasporobacterium sp.]